jgi:hypothetical protein
MTRESEKSKIRMSVIVDGKHINSLKKADEVIDQIFDEFGEQLKDKDDEIELLKHSVEELIKPKTCYECEWWDFNSYGIFKKCFNGKGNCVSTKSSFGCNRFKQKDNA